MVKPVINVVFIIWLIGFINIKDVPFFILQIYKINIYKYEEIFRIFNRE